MVIGDVVGLTPAVHGSITGLLSIGSPVHLSETIKTGPSGVIELQFLDNTHLMLEGRIRLLFSIALSMRAAAKPNQ